MSTAYLGARPSQDEDTIRIPMGLPCEVPVQGRFFPILMCFTATPPAAITAAEATAAEATVFG